MAELLLSADSTPPSGLASASDSTSSSQIGAPYRPIEKAHLSVRLRLSHEPPKSVASTLPTLDGLPEELLSHILSYIDRQQDFWCLCAVSRKFRRAATPRLYSEFRHELHKQPKRLHDFLRNIIVQPVLASYVTFIEIKDQQRGESLADPQTWRRWANQLYEAELSNDDRELFQEAAKELQLQGVDALETIAVREEARAALLLSRATNLTELSMTIPNLQHNRLLLDILRETTDQGTALQNLRTFNGIYYNFDGGAQGGFELAPISCLFRLPRIERVHAVACLEPEDDAFRGFDCPENTSTVTDIEFRRSSVCPKAMSLMLGACRALKRFYCDWGGHTVGWSEINFPIVGAALRKQEESLESLTLNVKKHYHTWPEAEDVLIPPLGSLAGFKRLTSIDAPGAALIGWDEGRVDDFPELHDILPRSIKSLSINQWTPGIREHLERLSDMIAVAFPDLAEISLQGAPDEVCGQKLQQMFDAKGAQVTLHLSDGEEVDHFD